LNKFISVCLNYSSFDIVMTYNIIKVRFYLSMIFIAALTTSVHGFMKTSNSGFQNPELIWKTLLSVHELFTCGIHCQLKLVMLEILQHLKQGFLTLTGRLFWRGTRKRATPVCPWIWFHFSIITCLYMYSPPFCCVPHPHRACRFRLILWFSPPPVLFSISFLRILLHLIGWSTDDGNHT